MVVMMGWQTGLAVFLLLVSLHSCPPSLLSSPPTSLAFVDARILSAASQSDPQSSSSSSSLAPLSSSSSSSSSSLSPPPSLSPLSPPLSSSSPSASTLILNSHSHSSSSSSLPCSTRNSFASPVLLPSVAGGESRAKRTRWQEGEVGSSSEYLRHNRNQSFCPPGTNMTGLHSTSWPLEDWQTVLLVSGVLAALLLLSSVLIFAYSKYRAHKRRKAFLYSTLQQQV